MITITALKWVPALPRGQVRDYRARWILKEAGWDYRVRLVGGRDDAAGFQARHQPFGQVPAMEEDGRPALFETGAIVWTVAERARVLIPDDPGLRNLALAWVFGALNSVEPYVSNLVEARYFIPDAEARKRREAEALPMFRQRLDQLQDAIGQRDWLVGDAFTVADLMMAGVLIIVDRMDMLGGWPILKAYLDRATDRPAYRQAVADQLADFEGHGPRDMGWDPKDFDDADVKR
ncbi:glutathione S-transferase family protein [Cypionkella sp.]|uniref:glutathione S-transferase family protein n=1 Tax=Cypionkella sp. TaxID=2811411 RepID=UPI002ABD0057|nr:glutathione S-transferase family protein [Cypionkella sp.]MDZ4394894.1 glutathione S-transferase family protein [Cypionkella sp.]